MVASMQAEGIIDKEYQELVAEALQEAQLPQDLKSLVGTVIAVKYFTNPDWCNKEIVITPITWVKVHLYVVSEWYGPVDMEFRDNYTWVPRCSLEVHLIENHQRIKHLTFTAGTEGWKAVLKKRLVWPWNLTVERNLPVEVEVL